MKPDPTLVLMLQTPECREVWEKVLDGRGLNDHSVELVWDTGIEMWLRCGVKIDPPHLGELWAIAKEKEGFCGLFINQDTGGTCAMARQDDNPSLAATKDYESPCAALLSYIVGKPWDAEKARWKE